jgi:hypothetical protein
MRSTRLSDELGTVETEEDAFDNTIAVINFLIEILNHFWQPNH